MSLLGHSTGLVNPSKCHGYEMLASASIGSLVAEMLINNVACPQVTCGAKNWESNKDFLSIIATWHLPWFAKKVSPNHNKWNQIVIDKYTSSNI